MAHPAASPTRRPLLALVATAAVALAAASLLTAAPPALAQPAATAATAATAEPAFAAAFARFQQAAAGDGSAVDDAAEKFGALSAAQPADPVLRAYAGAATAMRATTTLLPWRKLSYAEDGLAQIDKALAQLTPAHDAPARQGVPASLDTRFVAASTFLGLPSMFNRGARGAKLLDEVLKSPLLEAAPLGFKGAVWLRAARQAAADKQPAQARQWLDKIVASGAPQAAAAQAKLKEL